MAAWFSKYRALIGIVIGAAIGLYVQLSKPTATPAFNQIYIVDLISAIVFGAMCGATLARRTRQPQTVRTTLAGAGIGLVLALLFGVIELTPFTGALILRNSVVGTGIGAIIGSAPRPALKGAKIGGIIGAVCGLIIGVVFLVRGIPARILSEGIFHSSLENPVFLLAYTTVVTLVIGAAFWATLQSVFSSD
jgi:hypothetical protein